MKHFLISFLVFIIWSFFGLWLYSILQPNNLTATIISTSETNKKYDSIPLYEPKTENDIFTSVNSNAEMIAPAISSKGFSAILTNGNVLFAFENGVQITKNSNRIAIPPENISYLQAVKMYLANNADQKVEIVSFYSPSESFETPNHGYQRGTVLKNLMIQGGIPSNRITVKSSIKGISFTSEGISENGIQLQFKEFDPSLDIETTIPEKITLYPRYSGNQVLISQKLEDLTANVQQIMNQNPDLKLTVIGHTGNGGDANENYDKALAHARQVRWYLVENGGLDRNRIRAISEGESKGIYSNNTERGRRLNQRIEIKFRK
jgi:hypothetical protein